MTNIKKVQPFLKMPCLYILMRTDMDSMNPGKGMAQSSHLSFALNKAMRTKGNIQSDFLSWMATTEQDFGTTITLGGSVHQIQTALDRAKKDTLMCSGWVHDPTYPVRDGRVVHEIPVDTCAFIFGERKDIQFYTFHMEQHA